jgi:hypothetical protein
MQVKKLVLALAAAIAAPSAFAAPINIETSPIAVPVDNIMYVTGATAQTPSLAIALGKLCASASTGAGTLQAYTDTAAAPVGKAWKCVVPATATFTKLTGVTGPWIVYKNEGGSLNAITPLRNASTQTQLSPGTCDDATLKCTALIAKPEYFGLSDVRQEVFGAKGQLVARAGTLNNYTQRATGAGQGFGVVASPALLTLLRADQGLPATATPSISRQQYASLMAATSGWWQTLLPNTPVPASATTIILGRRSLTSGTQASAEAFFLNNPCSNGSLGGSATATAGTAAGQAFVDGTVTQIVKQEGSSDAVLNEVSSASALALGVVSLENNQTGKVWNYVAIDGTVAGVPADFQKKNILNGTYDFAYETYLFTTALPPTAAIGNNIADFTSAILADLGDGANLTTSYGLFMDPLSGTYDGTSTYPSLNHYSRQGNECAVSTFQI